MKFYYQSELDNLSNETIKEIDYYTDEKFNDKFYYKSSEEFENQRNDEDRIFYLENLADDLNLKQFNLTVEQEIIVAYMFVSDLFGRAYTYEVLKIMENTL